VVFVVESSDDEWSRSILLFCSRRLKERTFSIALSVRPSVRLSVSASHSGEAEGRSSYDKSNWSCGFEVERSKVIVTRPNKAQA